MTNFFKRCFNSLKKHQYYLKVICLKQNQKNNFITDNEPSTTLLLSAIFKGSYQ